MKEKIRKVVVVGGGTAGWMSAALLKRVLGEQVAIELVESEQIGIVGVGEATIPPIQHVNAVLGLNEAEFLRETKSTIKLAIRFENWRKQGDSYYHTFGAPGKSQAFCHFHHFWTRAQQAGDSSSLWDYDLNYLCAEAGKFAKLKVDDPMWELHYAYHFDASLYGAFLRKYSEQRGVKRTEGLVEQVNIHPESGHVESLVLKSGKVIEGDFFVDCSGIRGLLIHKKLGTGYEDWGHWLPCDRAMAVPSERFEETLPYTRSIAHSAGWQWRIPLQHRNGNGLVYSSNHYSDEQAADILLNNLESKALTDPKIIPFRTGRTRKQWNRNVVAVGLSSGFLEPLESTSIYLIQSAIVRLIHLFPHAGVSSDLVDEYNRQSQREYELIRDFIILHYYLNERDDSQFWRDARNMDVPDRLTEKIGLFRSNGGLVQDQLDIFLEPSWLQVMLGQGVIPQDYHPIADSLTNAQLKEKLANTKKLKMEPLPKIPSHDQFLEMFCKAG
ncbi:MAG: tryptophan 7-halogenase [Xanthomonadales bacterium]|jgi:tryptophan halogenase|nr:tryptophan 7-halogenase [Xanthomonadales bacterium]MDH3923295.1 tryptophan 7-halogenase [Xanthomonadales bacterium]MDH4001014.1 tryptophan 7-halogenase [Xanthomonadales bacterium]